MYRIDGLVEIEDLPCREFRKTERRTCRPRRGRGRRGLAPLPSASSGVARDVQGARDIERELKAKETGVEGRRT